MGSFKSLAGTFDNGGLYFKPHEGENRIRIVSEPVPIWTYFDQDNNKGVNFLTEDAAKAFAKTLPSGKKVSQRYAMYVLNRDSKNEVQVAQFGPQVMKELVSLATSSEYGFDSVPEYDVFIVKKGTGLDTEYTVRPARTNTPLTVEEFEEVQKAENLVDVLKKNAEDADQVPPEALR